MRASCLFLVWCVAFVGVVEYCDGTGVYDEFEETVKEQQCTARGRTFNRLKGSCGRCMKGWVKSGNDREYTCVLPSFDPERELDGGVLPHAEGQTVQKPMTPEGKPHQKSSNPEANSVSVPTSVVEKIPFEGAVFTIRGEFHGLSQEDFQEAITKDPDFLQYDGSLVVGTFTLDEIDGTAKYKDETFTRKLAEMLGETMAKKEQKVTRVQLKNIKNGDVMETVKYKYLGSGECTETGAKSAAIAFGVLCIVNALLLAICSWMLWRAKKDLENSQNPEVRDLCDSLMEENSEGVMDEIEQRALEDNISFMMSRKKLGRLDSSTNFKPRTVQRAETSPSPNVSYNDPGAISHSNPLFSQP
eukprot:Nk52_evm21s1073 gene=Nk52_evmTU21s1073